MIQKVEIWMEGEKQRCRLEIKNLFITHSKPSEDEIEYFITKKENYGWLYDGQDATDLYFTLDAGVKLHTCTLTSPPVNALPQARKDEA